VIDLPAMNMPIEDIAATTNLSIEKIKQGFLVLV
jgi:hypothetical protein